MARIARAGKTRTPSKGAGENRPVFDVQEAYALGCEALRRSQERDESPWRIQRDLADERGISPDMVKKSARFAKLYNQDELEDLLALRRPNGEPLVFRHVRCLIQVSNKRKRERFQQRAAKEDWTSDDLAREIKEWKGQDHGGGRRLTPPGSAAKALNQVAEYTRRWLKRYDELWSGQPDWLEGVTANVETTGRLRKVIDSLRLLAAGAGKLADSLETAPKRAGRRKPRRPSAK